jgi:hypothetical protein
VNAYVERQVQYQQYGLYGRYLKMAYMDNIMSDDSSCVSAHDGSALDHVRTHSAPAQGYASCLRYIHQRYRPSVAAGHPRSKDRARISRRTRRCADRLWSFSRKNIPHVEPERAENGRVLWYCKQCLSYSVSSTSGARAHIAAIHFTVISKEEV